MSDTESTENHFPEKIEQLAFEIYQQALDLDSHQQSKYIQQSVAENKALSEAVYALLESAEEAEQQGFMHTPAADIKQMGLPIEKTKKPIPLPPPIGNYKPIRLLGEGGFGQVFLAEQTEPVIRKVAIKLIRSELCDERFIKRFEAEWQMLAVLNHPNIAQIFDAGSGEDERPYLVMEYVEGTSIIEYCNQHQLDVTERLNLFLQVCNAIQHAHQKGVIHRDIKPENILVSELDGKAIPKVIDFGIAKALDLKVNEKTMALSTDFFGSPSYMSPEQIEQAELDIDTRSDVYGLGVLLYELVVGSPPFVNEDSLVALMNQILSQDPETPSSRVEHISKQQLTNIGKTNMSSLVKILKGGLDWIIIKALEKARDDRYPSASAFSADIDRYLADEPVYARAPTVAYRTRKFIHRHTIGVMASAAILVLLIAGIIGTTTGFINAKQEATRAQLAEANAQQTIRLLLEFLSAADPGEKGRELKVVSLLEAFEPRIGQLKQRPIIQASLMYTYASTYSGLGLYGEAESFAEDAFKIRNHYLGEKHPSTIKAIILWADLLVKQGKYKTAEKRAREAIVRTSGKDKELKMLRFNANSITAIALEKQGKFNEAEKLLLENLTNRRELLGDDHSDTLQSMTQLATVFWHQNRLDEAEKLHREVLTKRINLFGENHPKTINTLNELAIVVSENGNLKEGIILHRSTLAKKTKILGPEHPDTITSMANLAWVLGEQAQYKEAESLTRQAWEIEKRVLGEEHPNTLVTLGNLANALERLGQQVDAEILHRTVWQKRSKILGMEHPSTLTGLNDLAVNLARQKKYLEAKNLFQDLIIRRTNAVGNEHPGTLTSMGNLAWVLTKLKDYPAAVKLNRETLATKQKALGEEHPSTLSTLNNLANTLFEISEYSEAEKYFRLAMEKRQHVLGVEHTNTLQSSFGLAKTLQKLKQYKAAELLFSETLEIQLKVFGEDNRNTQRTLKSLEELRAIEY